MEQRNKKLIWFTVLIAIFIIVIGTVYKVYKNHIEHEYEVVEKKISENAKKCFLEEICTGNETTLGFLISSGYLDKQINPITKEYVDEALVITFDGEKVSVSIR
jgi:hypothetical protein